MSDSKKNATPGHSANDFDPTTRAVHPPKPADWVVLRLPENHTEVTVHVEPAPTPEKTWRFPVHSTKP